MPTVPLKPDPDQPVACVNPGCCCVVTFCHRWRGCVRQCTTGDNGVACCPYCGHPVEKEGGGLAKARGKK